jgi:hypothetical protein
MFDRMSRILSAVLQGKTTKKALLHLAQAIATKKQIKIDRTAKRMKDGLICWFCEHATDLVIGDGFPQQSGDDFHFDDFDLALSFRDEENPGPFNPEYDS